MSTNNKIQLNIPKGVQMEKPLFLDIQQKQFNIAVAENCRVVFVEEVVKSKYKDYSIKLNLAKNTEVTYIIVQDINKIAKVIVNRDAEINSNSKLTWLDIEIGGQKSISKILSLLNGKNAEVAVNTIAIGSKKQSYTLNYETKHNSSRSVSQMDGKIILNSNASASCTGSIEIPNKYANCSGQEKISALMLSPKAHFTAIPDLDVGNSAVKCSHAVSITRLNAEKMFYLNSRGITAKQGTKMLIEAEISPIVEKIKNDKIVRKLKMLIAQKITPMSFQRKLESSPGPRSW